MIKTAKSKKLIFNIRPLFLINLCINILVILFIVPFINLAIQYTMDLTKQSYITQENIIRFITTPSSLVVLLLILILVPLLLLSKFISLIYHCNMEGQQKRPFLLKTVFYGLFHFIDNYRKKKLVLLYFAVPFYIFMLLPVIIGITYYADMGTNFSANKETIIKLLVILLELYLSLLFIPYLFTIHCSLSEGFNAKDSLKRSKELFLNNSGSILKDFYLTNLILTIVFIVFYYLLIFLIALAVYLFTNKSIAISVFLSTYPKINFYATILYSMFVFTVNIDLITSLFYKYHSEGKNLVSNSMSSSQKMVSNFKNRHKLIVNSLFLFVMLAAMVNFYLIIHNGSLYLSEALTGIQISSHRGNSHIAPENTIPALENAIIANSDYAEIDVQMTKDGTLVLLHDKNLKRTAGVNRYIYDLTFEETAMLDVGSWFGMEFIDTKIPTLEEVLEHCKGRINLNIEVKASKKSPGLSAKLVELIEKYDFVNQCVVSSSDYSTLVTIKFLNKNIKTGYIISRLYGNLYDKENVDFYSIRSRYITKNTVDRAHQAGKEVHAWTVNSTREMERLKSIDIDCIITDNPVLAREVLYRDDTNATFIQFINRMFTNRSLYTLLN